MERLAEVVGDALKAQRFWVILGGPTIPTGYGALEWCRPEGDGDHRPVARGAEEGCGEVAGSLHATERADADEAVLVRAHGGDRQRGAPQGPEGHRFFAQYVDYPIEAARAAQLVESTAAWSSTGRPVPAVMTRRTTSSRSGVGESWRVGGPSSRHATSTPRWFCRAPTSTPCWSPAGRSA